ncbi:MAG: MFS transporter [Rickettsiales bacterium]
MSYKNRLFITLMWLLPLSFFTYQFVLRLWPSIMMTSIMQTHAIDATAFGLLASFYYWGYAGFQVPIAIWLDKYGVRFVVFLCAMICGVATLAATYADNWYVVLASRFFVGVGSAVGILGVSKALSEWFSKENYGRMIGLTFTIGLMGAIYGGKPTTLLVEQLGSEKVATTLAMVSMLIGLVTLLFYKKPKSPKLKESKDPLRMRDLLKVLTSPTLCLLAIANLFLVGSLEGFADVWGVNYLITAYGIAKADAAEISSFIFVGMLFGGPLLTLISLRLGNFAVIALSGIGMAAILLYVFTIPAYNWYLLASLFFMVGVFCCYQVLVFAVGCDLVKPQLLGVTVAFLNSVNMLGGSFFHSIIGKLMDTYWTGEMVNGVRLYGVDAYNHALFVIPLCALLGSVIVLFVGFKSRRKAMTLQAATA